MLWYGSAEDAGACKSHYKWKLMPLPHCQCMIPSTEPKWCALHARHSGQGCCCGCCLDPALHQQAATGHPQRLACAQAFTTFNAQSVQQPDGSEKSLAEYAGTVTLVVNVASQCGYTESNYRGLEEIRQKYHPQGFEV